jgi:sec-independent protein translocase protein TatC
MMKCSPLPAVALQGPFANAPADVPDRRPAARPWRFSAERQPLSERFAAMAKTKRKRYDEDLFKDTTMTFGEHLEELRAALFKSLVGLALGFVLGLFVAGSVVDYIEQPLRSSLGRYYQTKAKKRSEENPNSSADLKQYVDEQGLTFEQVLVDPDELASVFAEVYPELPRPAPKQADPAGSEQTQQRPLAKIHIFRSLTDDPRTNPQSLSPHEAFTIWVKAALLVGALLASPWVFYQIWSFVAAGLYPHEKRYVHVFLPFSLGLFLSGAALAFFFVFEPVLDFLFSFNASMGIDPVPRISEWLSFVIILPLGFGIAFQLPLVMLFLERIGIFDVAAYLSKWRIAVLVIAVLSMLLTPADPYSMLLMAIPLTVLYFGGILVCKLMPRAESPFDDFDD